MANFDRLSNDPGLRLNLGAELNWVPLGTVLTDARLLTDDQLAHALAVTEATGRRLGEIVVELGFVTEREIAQALAEQYELEFVDLDRVEPDPAAVERLPEQLARRFEALPLKFLGPNLIQLAIVDPTNLRTSDDLRLALGVNVRLAVVDASQLGLALARAYRKPFYLLEHAVVDEQRRVDDIRDMASSVPTINLVNSLLTNAVEEGASDVHFEPGREHVVVRIRVDGMMRELARIPKHMQSAVASRLKIMAGLDIAERRTPQDGRVSARFGGDPLDLRIAVIPTGFGEHVTLRILSRRGERPTIADLGMTPQVEATFLEALGEPYGAILVCGPTGSGKTTTLYAALDYLNRRDRMLMTIEDPIEHRIDGVNQVEVDTRAGLTFARGLRTMLRSDPDVLLVGEIRDEETAMIASQAAMTGHLVLSSLHAHNAASAVVRLRDMGVETGLIASALNCIVAQRLARRLCVECRESHEVRVDDLGPNPGVDRARVIVYRSTGCTRCSGTGFAGLVPLREVMPIHGEVRGLVERSTEEIFAAAVRGGMQTLRQDGIRLCLDGVCSLAEIRRVTGGRLV